MAVEVRQSAGVADERGAFEAFYRRERTGVFEALAFTLGEADLAAEAVDEAMVRAFQRWARVRRYDNPAGWVYRVGLNWAVSRIRRRRRAVSVAEVPDESGAVDPPLADEQLAAAVAALPVKQRAVVVLRCHLDWSVPQIASAVGVAEGTVKSRLHRGLAAVREQVEDA